MRSFRNIVVLVPVFLFYACEEKINLDLNNDPSNLLIVEGMITNQRAKHLVRLSRPFTEQNGVAIPVSGATVIIFENDQPNLLTEIPSGSGMYYTGPIRAVIGNAYTLYINDQGKEYIASDFQQPVEPLGQLGTLPTSDGLFTLSFETEGAASNYIEYDITWQGTSYCSQSNNPCFARVIDYDLKTVSTQEVFKPKKAEVNFPTGTVIVRRKFSVSDTYREFLRGMLSETEWHGGPFDLVPANATTNLSEGASGFFAVSTVVSDTTIVK